VEIRARKLSGPQFDEYISAALASIKYADFVAKGESSGVTISGSGEGYLLLGGNVYAD
jgi:hypothetical protein